MTAGRICQREVDLAEPKDSVQAAANRMLQRKVGTLVVIDASRIPIGIVTDRDIVVRVVARGADPKKTAVGDVMTKTLDTIDESAPVESVLALMRNAGVRRVPVTDPGGRLVGLLSLDDVLAALSEEFVRVGELLAKQTPREAAKR
ncbi:MAG TPA: CBS domain-containing protein [Planctomycetota bacterium]|jgi:CBS domain-containing protein|nr:CBS domain-containing protein [Planctomycetota bacterium]